MQSCGYTHSLPSPYQSARPERNAQTAAPMSYLHPNQPSESKCRVYQVSRTLPGPESSFELVAAAVPQLQLVLLAPRSLLLCPCCLLVLPCHLCDGFLQSPKGSWGSSNIRYSVGLSFHIANQLRPVGIGIPALILTLGLTLSAVSFPLLALSFALLVAFAKTVHIHLNLKCSLQRPTRTDSGVFHCRPEFRGEHDHT